MNEVIPPPAPVDDNINVEDTPESPAFKVLSPLSTLKPITGVERLEMASSMRQQAAKLIEFADRINPENQTVMIINRVDYERKQQVLMKIAAELKNIT